MVVELVVPSVVVIGRLVEPVDDAVVEFVRGDVVEFVRGDVEFVRGWVPLTSVVLLEITIELFT